MAAKRELVGKVEYYWQRTQSQLDVCEDCEDVIYGDMHELMYEWWQAPSKVATTISSLKLCPSCYEESKQDYIVNFDPWDEDEINPN